jgi:hypothetical protein
MPLEGTEMHTLLILGGGHRVDALLLSASTDRLRVAIPGRGDTVEYRLIDGQWQSDRGERMEIGAITAADGIGLPRFVQETQTRTFSAF